MKPHKFTSSPEQLETAADALMELSSQIHQTINGLMAEHADYARITLAKLDKIDDHVSNSHNLCDTAILLEQRGCVAGANALKAINEKIWRTISTLSRVDREYIHALLTGVDMEGISTSSNLHRISDMLIRATGRDPRRPVAHNSQS